MHFRISASFLVFSPEIDEVLVGVVSKVSPDHVGCVVHGLFNASIAKDQFPMNSWSWDEGEHYWTANSPHGQLVLTQGSIIKFRVTKYCCLLTLDSSTTMIS